ncbi:GNAT family N-acetyltransferase [Jatrophihabitans lederbergiae]|uniref:GNAT family N-acetyltransferase n=1 Tax=Jatrophihabitans lederbergiae TaxID=3075547 RepID=A0ABU2JDU1_9ACTN|nr:GNAT family N-acetyltransferase [Jatrophihabitans sp. DSM 44399]MDT0262433.1 GNAT family N-acetyltransferase [Jatrophihabitans sp. DSM 44399]
MVEIRAVGPGDAADWVRVLPQYTGRPMWEPAPAAWYDGPEPWPAPSTAGVVAEQVRDLEAPDLHPVAAVVDGRMVGASAMISHELTVPGLLTRPLGGVTSTGVLVTHRRRGLLRHMMQRMFDDALARGESVAGLSASEGSIYGNFGFAPATDRTVWPALHEKVRACTVGELAARPGRWSDLSDAAVGTDGPPQYLVHRTAGEVDGVARFRQPWGRTTAEAGTVVVDGLCTTSTAAYRALWQTIFSVDLARRVVAAGRPTDEPLRWMLTDPRGMRVTRQSDNLWLRLLDVPSCLSRRTYPYAETLVVEVADDPMCRNNTGAWRLETSGTDGNCARTTASPDLTVDIRALSRLFLGGGSARLLAMAGLIQEHRSGTLDRLGRLLRTDPAPFNSFAF